MNYILQQKSFDEENVNDRFVISTKILANAYTVRVKRERISAETKSLLWFWKTDYLSDFSGKTANIRDGNHYGMERAYSSRVPAYWLGLRCGFVG